MIRFKLFVDKDKETKWLNEMADEGYELKRFTAGFYSFDEGEPEKYRYQIDISKGLFLVEQDYKEFMEEQGIEIVCLWGPWVILRKQNDGTDFTLYSDNESLIEHYTKIRTMFKIVTVIEMVCLAFATYAAIYLKSVIYYSLLVLIGLIVLAFMKITFHTNDVIEKLKGESGEGGKRKMSPLLFVGLLINSVVLIGQSSLPDEFAIGMESVAIVLMVGGMFYTMKKRRN